jgi:hypothetical protein
MTNTGYSLLFNLSDPAEQIKTFFIWFTHKTKMLFARGKLKWQK